jgi:hypothetical protein
LLQDILSISVQKKIEKGDNDINLIDLATNAIDEKDNFDSFCLWIERTKSDIGRFGSCW